MPKYQVTICYYATAVVDVEADTPQAAAEQAYDDAPTTICHQCGDKFDIGDPYRAIVSDAAGDEVYDDGEDSGNG